VGHSIIHVPKSAIQKSKISLAFRRRQARLGVVTVSGAGDQHFKLYVAAEAGFAAQQVGFVGLLPGCVDVGATEVAVGRGSLVDWALQVVVAVIARGARFRSACDIAFACSILYIFIINYYY
jgi:hypothetical protein